MYNQPNETETLRVIEHVINPMKRTWSAEFDADTISDYVNDLHIFSGETMDRAIADLRREQKRKPTLAHVFEACQKHKPIMRDSISKISKNPWEERVERKQKLIDDYVKQFCTISQTYAESVREGWHLDLRDYVYCVADVQAQMIVGERNIGWNGMSIFGAGNTISDDMRKEFLAAQRRQANIGMVDIAIPTSRLNEWKQSVQRRDEKKHIPATKPPEYISASTVQLDAEIARQIQIKGIPTPKTISPAINF